MPKRVRPAAVIPFIDRLAVWLPKPASAAELKELRTHSGPVHVGDHVARFDRKYLQRLDIKRPGRGALRLLSARSVLINQVEVAIDYVFASDAEAECAYDFLHRHLARRWHGRNQNIYIHPGSADTRYDAGRSATNEIVFYKQQRSRITRELHVVHLEWRLNRLKGVQSAGICSIKDLLIFDHRAFWRERLLLLDVSKENLGRLFRNAASGSKRQKSDAQDARNGQVLINCVAREEGWTVQDLIHEFRSSFRIRRACEVLDIEDWLPRILVS